MRAKRAIVSVLLAVAWLTSGLAGVAEADPSGVTVSGTISLADRGKRGEPPARGRGFIKRIRNPLKPPKAFNPLPQIVVVLEGGSVAPSDKKPPKHAVKLALLGESFERPLLAVVAGSEVEIKNKGRKLRRLFSPGNPELVPSDPINKNGRRRFKVATANRSLEVRDHDSAHLSGHIVAFEHSYFSLVDAAGRFQIAGVPSGTWTVRVWYGDGWLKLPKTTVDVPTKRKAQPIRITLPARLAIEGK